MKRRTLLAVAGSATIPTIAGCLSDETEADDPAGNETDGEGSEQSRRPLFSESFSATSQGGFLAIDEDVDSRAEAREAGYALPEGEEVLTLEAEVADDGTWESTEVEFPPIQADFGIEASIELPNGLSGVVLQDRMTASGTLRVVIETFDDDNFSFEVEATSEKSGNLEGETNFEEEPLTATLVDNEFLIDEDSGNMLIDDPLGLPADEPGTNWFEIDLELTGN